MSSRLRLAPLGVLLLCSAASASVIEINPDNGKRLAESLVNDAGQSCASCHGLDGNTPTDEKNQSPYLASQWAVYLERQMRAYQLNARAQEQAHSALDGASENDLKDLAAWFASQPLSGDRPAVDAGADLDLGQQLYQMGSTDQGVVPCQVCHGAGGEGKQFLSYPVLRGQNAPYLALQLQRFRDGDRAGWEESYLGNVMHAIAKPLSDTDIEALAAYIEQLP